MQKGIFNAMRMCEECKIRPATFYSPDFGDLCDECQKVSPGCAIRGLPIDYEYPPLIKWEMDRDIKGE